MSAGSEEEHKRREAYRQEREAREMKLLRTPADMEALFGREAATDYEEKDRNFRIRNAMLDPSADSDWADEALVQGDEEEKQEGTKGGGVK